MTSQKKPDVSRLQRILRESKAQSASAQETLDDPDGVGLKIGLEETLEKALRLRRLDIAAKAAAELENLQHKEAALERSMDVADEAERHAVDVLINVQADKE